MSKCRMWTKNTCEKKKKSSNKKLCLGWTMNRMEKSLEKIWTNKTKKNSNNQREIAACEQKTTSEKKISSNKKLGLEWTMNGMGKPFKKINLLNRKNSKNQKEIAACEQKTTSEKAIFVQTPFSHSTLKLERKNFTAEKHSLFHFTSCFGVTKITTPIWLQKTRKCVNRS